MSDKSAIEWTDATWNPTTGCTKVSPGCARCYIERTPAFRIKGRRFVSGDIPLELHKDRLEQPLHWRTPRRVFVNSLSDLFHESVPDAFIDRVFAVMALTPQHTFQVLTKRAERMRDYMRRTKGADGVICRVNAAARAIPKGAWWKGDHTTWPWSNVWLGVSVENRRMRDERIPQLLKTPAAVKFISAEPLLEDIATDEVFSSYLYTGWTAPPFDDKLDWVIVGGESGPKARGFDVAWARSINRQCQAAGVPVFVKQLGARAYGPDVHSAILRDKKGGDPDEWPADLRVREFPRSTRNSPPLAERHGGD
jgi:protein gp37